MGKYAILLTLAGSLGLAFFAQQSQSSFLNTTEDQADRHDKTVARQVARSGFNSMLSDSRMKEQGSTNHADCTDGTPAEEHEGETASKVVDCFEGAEDNPALNGTYQGGSYEAWVEPVSSSGGSGDGDEDDSGSDDDDSSGDADDDSDDDCNEDDHDRGHGNDCDGYDEDNPGNSDGPPGRDDDDSDDDSDDDGSDDDDSAGDDENGEEADGTERAAYYVVATGEYNGKSVTIRERVEALGPEGGSESGGGDDDGSGDDDDDSDDDDDEDDEEEAEERNNCSDERQSTDECDVRQLR